MAGRYGNVGPTPNSSVDMRGSSAGPRGLGAFRPGSSPSAVAASLSQSRRTIRSREGSGLTVLSDPTMMKTSSDSDRRGGSASFRGATTVSRLDDEDAVVIDEDVSSCEPSPVKPRTPLRNSSSSVRQAPPTRASPARQQSDGVDDFVLSSSGGSMVLDSPVKPRGPAQAGKAAAKAPPPKKASSKAATTPPDDPLTTPTKQLRKPRDQQPVAGPVPKSGGSSAAKPSPAPTNDDDDYAVSSASTSMNAPTPNDRYEKNSRGPTASSSPVQPTPAPSGLPDLPRRPNTASSDRPRHISLGKKELLGKGSFGMVYRAMDLDTNRILAVKELCIVPGSVRKEQLEVIRKEMSFMQKLDHPNIVKYLGEHWDGQQYLRIFMEYVPGGTISALLRSFGAFNEAQASRYAAQMLAGLAYLHDRNIAHRDLKGDNMLVDVDGSLKLADFGTAKELVTQSKSVAGTAFFMAPEVIKGVGHGTAADLWSAGCCVVEMVTGKPPFSSFSNQYAIMMHVAELKDGDFPVPANASPLLCDFLSRCFKLDPAERTPAAELLKHQWIVEPPAPQGLQSIHVLSQGQVQAANDKPIHGGSVVMQPTFMKDSYNPIQSFDE